jgi:NlpC/P60 family
MSQQLSRLKSIASTSAGPVCALLLLPFFLLLSWHDDPMMITISLAVILVPVFFLLSPRAVWAEEPAARTATLRTEELKDFASQPEAARTLITSALALTAQRLRYQPASHDPAAGGMDCSGFVYHLLQKHGHKEAPRQSNDMYAWVWKAGTFRACNSLTMDTFEFQPLRPGDLLFWVNTDKPEKRDPPVTHVMIYLGERASDGQRVCAGASDGRSYDGQRMSGVSVFDFRLPAAGSASRFIGYARLPGGAEQGK